MTELYALLTLKLRFPPDYVMDRIQWYEIRALLKYRHFACQDLWETARLGAFVTAQVNSTKKLDMQELIPLYWEEPEEPEPVTQQDIERLKLKAEKYIKSING